VFFSVKELELRKARFDVALPPGEIEYQDRWLRQAGPLEAVGSIELLASTLGEIRIQGRLKVMMETECDRCLERAEFPIESDFDLFYRPAAPARSRHGAEEVEIDEGESEIAFYQGAGLDLKEILREYILLSLPMQRTCRAECRGICPVCGQNRNLVECRCHAPALDDRWSALKKLQNKGI
jgi:uncharacterized protein